MGAWAFMQRLSLESILPKSVCTPNMKEEQTQELTRTEGNCTRVAGRYFTVSCLRKIGKKSLKIGIRRQKPSCPSGSVSVPARSLVIPSLLMMKRMVLLNLQQKRKKKRKRRKKKRRKRNKSSRRSDKSSKRFTNHL